MTIHVSIRMSKIMRMQIKVGVRMRLCEFSNPEGLFLK